MKHIKVMLDECITMRCAEAVIESLKLHQPPVEAYFLISFVKRQGALDGDWTLKLTPPEEWLVISSDAGRSPPRIHAKGPPLHLILPRRRITSVFLRGKSLTQVPGSERGRVIIAKLPEILAAAAAAPARHRFKLSKSGASFVLSDWLSGNLRLPFERQ